MVDARPRPRLRPRHDARSPRAGEPRGFLGRVRAGPRAGRGPTSSSRRLVPAVALARSSGRASGSSSCGTRPARSRPSATAGSASADRAPTGSRGSTRTTPHAIVSSDHDVPFYAEAFGIPEERVVPTGIPRMDRFFDERARAARPGGGARRLSADRGPHDHPVSPRRSAGSGPRAPLRFRPARLRGAPCRWRSRRTRSCIIKMHPFVHRAAGHPRGLPRPADRRVEGGHRRQRPAVRVSTCSSPTTRRSCSSTRPWAGRCCSTRYDLTSYIGSRDFYVPFEAFVPGRIVRTFPELVDAIRRDDYQVEKVAAFAADTLRLPRRRGRRIASSTSWSSPGERVPGPHRVDRLAATAIRRQAPRWRGRG